MAAKKKAAASDKAKKPRAKKDKNAPATRGKRKPAQAGSAGLAPSEAAGGGDDAKLLAKQIEADGGVPLATYKDPLFGKSVVFAILPLEKVERTVFQRDVSQSHVDKLVDAMKRTGAYLDPIIAVREGEKYHSPNGGHRLASLVRMGAKSVTALVVTDPKVAYKILALNTEKAHALKEKSLETIRMLRALSEFGGTEESFQGEFEDPALLTLGAAYEKRTRLSGSAYHPLLKRVDSFLGDDVKKALSERERRGDRLLAFDDAVSPLVEALRAKGINNPGLRNVVLSRVAPLPWKGARFEGTFDEVLDKVTAKAKTYDVDKLDIGQFVGGGGGAPDDGGDE
jgi:ParB family chromosome partitioning protein